MRVRTLFISDLHLGYRGCRAEALLAFLEAHDPEQLVLVGDVVDLWSLSRVPYWPVAHQAVVRRLTAMAASGVHVVYVPGNHDAAIREWAGTSLAGVQVVREYQHVLADGRRFLVVHGDCFDDAVRFPGWLAHLGAHLYDFALWMSHAVNAVRRRFSQRARWFSLATWLKTHVPEARRYVRQFEVAALHEARRRGFDGIICGHIHQPALHESAGCCYANDGDWVEHGTGLVEHADGRLELRWADTWLASTRRGSFVEGLRPLPVRQAA
jgi:UDP-2,3-diacylglucosamine pyrophosphatase LpxH